MSDIENSMTDPRNAQNYALKATPFRIGLVATLTWAFKLFMDLSVEGLEYFPRQGGVIVAANHVTNFDVFPMQISLPRPIFYMAKDALFKNPLVAMGLRSVGAFPVDRNLGSKDDWAMDHARKVLENGLTLGMFPEGTRSHGKGLGLAKSGTARFAIEKQVPVIPMAITGSDKFFREIPKRNPVTVKLCPPLFPDPGEDALAFTDRIMFCMAANLPEEMRGVYANIPKGFEQDRS
jgi:1-acyl-sn-glycerol-3-phosphate acyltransferase